MSDLDIQAFVEEQVKAVKTALVREKALIAVSGGVDSTVSAVITHRAIGENLSCVFIDDNFMRLGESERVKDVLSSPPLNLPVKVLDVRERFMRALKGLSDAEEKRKAFRQNFYDTLSEAAKREGCRFLVQGTIKADVLETKGGVKTQHNVLEQVGIDPVERFGFKVVEPVASLYKYQVREVARYLGAPTELSERQPFPGPGLSVRVVGEITEEKLEELKKATAVVEEVFKSHKPDQYFAAIFRGEATEAPDSLTTKAVEALTCGRTHVKVRLLREKATGMINGARTYGYVVTVDLDPVSLRERGHDSLEDMRARIQRSHTDVTRVLYLIDRKERDGYTIALRAVKTRDFITADLAQIPWQAMTEASTKILAKCAKVKNVYWDATPKPPATVEFE